MPMRAERWFAALGSLGLQLLLVLGLLELIGRGLDPLGISYYPETARYLDTLILEEPIGYRNRPGLQGEFLGVPVRINSLGLREREIGSKVPGEFRILVLGDSVPFGMGVPEEAAFPRQLEQLLERRHPERAFRVINMGVPSYNTEQEKIQLETLGLQLQPDAVILLFSPNDIEPKLWVFEKRKRWYVDVIQRSYAGSLLYLLWRETRQRLAEALVRPTYAAGPIPDGGGVALGEYRLDSPRWQAVDRALTAIHAMLAERGVPFVLFSNQELPFITELLQSVARREGFTYVDLKRREDPRWAGIDERDFHNSVTDAHPSALGHRALATLMVENLEKMLSLAER